MGTDTLARFKDARRLARLQLRDSARLFAADESRENAQRLEDAAVSFAAMNEAYNEVRTEGRCPVCGAYNPDISPGAPCPCCHQRMPA